MSAQRDPWWRVLVCPELLVMLFLVGLMWGTLSGALDFAQVADTVSQWQARWAGE